MKIKKGDFVVIISGNDRGKSGKVLRVFPKRSQIIVENVNFIKRHTKPSQQNPQGGIVEKEAAIHVSNVMMEFKGQKTRIGYRFLKTGRKVRVARKTGEDIDT